MFSAPIFFTSDANTASGAAVESMQFAWRGRKSACKFHCTIHRLKQCRRLGTTPSDLNSILCCCVVTISKLKSSPPLLVEGVYFTDEARSCRKMAAPRNKNTPVMYHHTLMEMTKCPPFFRKLWAFSATILVWSGWATSAKMTSTIPKKTRKPFYRYILAILVHIYNAIKFVMKRNGVWLLFCWYYSTLVEK